MSAHADLQQARAANPAVCAWVEANAGSGKTKVLIDRVARLLLQNAKPDAILCITYTKAAASEMQARLFQRLGGWCVMPDATLRSDLARLQGREPAGISDKELGAARELFARALETPGGLRIETIHAFCARVLRRFPLEARVPPGFSEMDEAEAAKLWQASLRALGEQLLAGGGSALERAARTASLYAGARGLDVLKALEKRRDDVRGFIAKSGGIDAAEQALRDLLGASDQDVDSLIAAAMGPDLPRSALRAVLAMMPRYNKGDAGLADTVDFALSNQAADERLERYLSIVLTKKRELRDIPFSKAAAEECPLLADLFNTNSVPQGSETLRLLAVVDALNARQTYERSAALLRLADWMFADYERRKSAAAKLDFADLVERASGLLHRSGAAAWVLWKLDGGLSHVLVDEAQDTSPLQWSLVEALTGEFFAGLGREQRDGDNLRTLFVVGDQKQSIYSFQGADPERFLEKKRSFGERARLAEIPFLDPGLATSFRSTPEVLRFVDEAFDTEAWDGKSPFSRHPPEEADVMRHLPHRGGEVGCVEFWPVEPKPAPGPAPAWDAPRGAQGTATSKTLLAGKIAGWIAKQIDDKTGVWDGGRLRPARPGDFLILVRVRGNGLFDALLQALKRADLPVAGADRIALLDSLAVQDLLNLVRFALCPEDDLTLAEILKGPFGGLDEDRDLFPLAHGRTGSLWRALRSSSDPRHAGVRDFLADVLKRRHHPPYEFLTDALERGRHLPAPGWDMMLGRFGGPAREPVVALIDRAAAFDAEGPSSLEGFLAEIERQGGEVTRELSGAGDEIRVMTVHGAKGLEAPIVIVPDTCNQTKGQSEPVYFSEDGAPLWAGSSSTDAPLTKILRAEAKARAQRESRRLLYVALTRARDRLLICGAATGNGQGRPKDCWHIICEAAMKRLTARGDAEAFALGPPPEAEGDDDATPADDDAPKAYRVGKLLAAAETAAVPAMAAALPAWLREAAPAEAIAPRTVAPSSIGGAEPPVLAPFGPQRARRLRRGRLIHALLEALPGIAPAERSDAARAFVRRQDQLSESEAAEIADAALGVINDPQFAAVFGPGGRAEAPVVGRLGDRVISGRVDRLVVTADEVLIVDYKSDRPAPHDIDDVGETYIAQLSAYRGVLQRAWPGRRVRCALVWTDGPRLMEIPAERLAGGR